MIVDQRTLLGVAALVVMVVLIVVSAWLMRRKMQRQGIIHSDR